MSLTTVTHLNFRGRAAEALGFYQSVFGGELQVTRYAQLGMPAEAPDADKVVFGRLFADNGFRVLAYDVPGSGPAPVEPTTRREQGLTLTSEPFFLSVQGQSLEEVRGYWDGLADGATVVEELAPSAWSPGFGMLTDRFGVTWVLDVAPVVG
ncbi:VOC family protein [Desertihabitans aurantiacus]|uniref:VOC family protein n=1 Tax=Desertihabitans aurantiacus TaxID=2282477 RepID=UPI000DF7B921|nr:VOC family protein [Desertihabitans aurantiacus]